MFKRNKKKGLATSAFFDKVKDTSGRKKKMAKRILLFLVFVFLIYRFFAGPYGFIQIHSLRQEKRELEHESRMLQAQVVDAGIEKRRLASDSFYLEKQARERLGMIKQGEKMYRVIHTEGPDSTQSKNSTQTPPPDSSRR
ncbi:MAG: septum formation initiator family protein [Candidatus Zixiibacteriota bacterium]